MMDETVLCYIEKDHQFLMLYRNKEKHDLNHGKWIGIGGHLEKGETKESALIREVKEETGLNLLNYQHRGNIIFKNEEYEEIMYLYTSNSFIGELIVCDEGELAWVDIDKVLSLPSWEGDKVFLPLLIHTDNFISLQLTYEKDHLVEVTNL